MLPYYPALPVEFHLTTAPLAPGKVSGFETLCKQVGGKALLIELARGQYCQQPMLSLVTTMTSASNAVAHARQLAKRFEAAGYPVLRLKLEVPAWSAAMVRSPQVVATPYYEWHGRVSYEQPAELRAWCERHAVHLSINALRQRPDVRFVTLREFGTLTQFVERIMEIRAGLAANDWVLTKQQAEFCFFDSEVSLDTGWLTT